MEEFSFTPDAVQNNVTPNDVSEFSFIPDEVQPDLTKVGAHNIFSLDGSNTNAAKKLNLVNRSWVEKFAQSDFGKFGDTQSKAVVRGLFDIAAGLGTMIRFYGDNMILPKGAFGLDDKTIDRINTFGRGWQKFGSSIKKGSDFVLNSKTLELDKDIFAGDIIDNPSVTRVSSAIMSAAPSLLGMVGIARATGSAGLAYFVMGGVDSADVYEKAKETGKTQETANLLYTSSQAGTALIDRMLSPLEKIMGNSPSTIWKKISQKIASGLAEGSAEGAQTVWQNAVTKYGIDDTQALMDGVIEAAIGGFGSGALAAGTFNTAAERLKEKGMTDRDIENISQAAIDYVQKHPDEINDIAFQQLNKGLDEFEKFVESHKGTPEAQKALQTKADLEQVYTDVSERLKKVGVSENVANADAKIWQGIALWGSQESGLSPLEYMKQRMPKVERTTYEQFKNKGKTLEEKLDDYIPYQLPAEAYNKQGKADVNSEAFKRWFGDSKVVDESGRPLKMVHFSGNEFSQFDKNRTGINNDESAVGFWFADRDDFAFNNEYHPVRYDVYLKMDNPLIIEGKGTETNPWADTDIDNLDPYTKFEKMFNDLMYQDPQMWDERVSESLYGGFETQKIKLHFANLSEERKREVIKSIVDKLKTQGYDGIIIKNTQFDSVNPDEKINQYVVFEPNQIKSVYNRGTFDPNNDNIYYQSDKNKNIVKITGKEFGGYTDSNDLRRKAYKYFQDNLQGQYVQHPTLGKIKFIRRGIDKLKSTSADIDKLKLVPKIKEIIETSQFLRSETPKKPHGNIVKFHYLSNNVNLEGKNIDVFISIAEDNEGNFFYNINKDKNQPSQDDAVQMRSGEGLADKSAININITPTRENVNKTLYQEAEAPKGAYMQNLDRNGVIYLFENADASTFMHETAHFFRKELEGFDTARSREMLQKMSEWENQEFDKRYKLKEENGRYVVADKIGNVIYGAEKPFFDAETAREYARNEIFARGFEQYLREGKAPNNYLKQAFRSFWNWLRHLYKAAEELGVDINDSIRSVYGEIIGGKDLDFYLTAPVDEVLQQHFAENEERQKEYDRQIALAQAQPVKKGFFRNIAQERTESAKGRNEWWNKAVVPISTRAKRVNIKLRNKLRAYDYGVGAKLNQYYAQIKPFLDKWAKMTETDAIAFDLALKNSYVEKQLEIVNKYDAYDEFVAVKNLLNSLFDQAVDVGIEMGYSADYFPRQIDDVEGFMSAMYGSPYASQLRRALKEADPDNVMTNEERAEFFNKYLRGFNRRDLNKPLPGNVKDRTIDIVTAEMNRYYKPSMQALINYIEGMNTSIESRKFWGFKSDDIDRSIGALTANMIDSGLIKPEQDAEVQEILRARFKARGVTNKYLLTLRNWAYMYTMGGINSAITQIDDISSSLYKAGLWNTVEAVFSRNRPGLSREELGLERIGQEFVEASTSSKAIRGVFKLTGLDKIDAFGKNTLINATFNKFQKMADNNEKELRARLEPVLEEETSQTIADIKNGVISENVKLLMFNELADMQPISLSEMPEWYLTGGNGRVFYMLKTFLIKRLDIFRNECYDKYKQGNVKTSVQNLFRLSILMMMTGMSKDAIIDMLFGREFDLTDAVVNNFLGLFGLSKYSLYQARYEGPKAFLEAFLIPPIYPMAEDLFSDVYKSLFSKKGKDISDYEIWKGFPLVGRFYYWWGGGGRTKLEKKNKKKLK